MPLSDLITPDRARFISHLRRWHSVALTRAETTTAPLLGAILLIAVAARVGAIWTVGGSATLHGDENFYVGNAASIVDHGVYRGSFRPPGQSAFIAIVFALFGKSLFAARVAQACLSLLAVAAIYDVARKRSGRGAAVVAGTLCAIHPTIVSYTHVFWAETLYTTLLTLFVWCLNEFDLTGRRRLLPIAGLLLGCAALTRETALLVTPFAVAWVAGRSRRSWRTRVWIAVLFLVGTCAAVGPWTIRNYQRSGDLILISTNRWRAVAFGNVPKSERRKLFGESMRRAYQRSGRGLEREEFSRRVALDAIRSQQPWWLPRKMVTSTRFMLSGDSQLARFVRHGWLDDRGERIARHLVRWEFLFGLVLVPLGTLGLWITDTGRLRSLVVSVIALHWMIYVVSFAQPRFVVPLLPLFALYLGFLLAREVPWKTLHRARLGLGLACTVLLLLATLLPVS